MKKKEKDELKSKSPNELKSRLSQLEKEKINQVMDTKAGKVKNVHLVRGKKRDIATIKTIIALKTFIEKKVGPKDESKNQMTKGAQNAAS